MHGARVDGTILIEAQADLRPGVVFDGRGP